MTPAGDLDDLRRVADARIQCRRHGTGKPRNCAVARFQNSRPVLLQQVTGIEGERGGDEF